MKGNHPGLQYVARESAYCSRRGKDMANPQNDGYQVLGEQGGKVIYAGNQHKSLVCVQNCHVPGCEAHCGCFRPDNQPVDIERARELALLAGWHEIVPRLWLCPRHVKYYSATQQSIEEYRAFLISLGLKAVERVNQS